MKRNLIAIASIVVIVVAIVLFNTTHSKKPTSKNNQQTIAYKNGLYSGSVDSAYYGNVQVQVNIQKGKIINVTYLEYPNADTTSVYIAKGVLPYLKKEVLRAQSARVSIITGATFTSQAFIKSLTTALNKA